MGKFDTMTIAEAMGMISTNGFLLPSFQREYVWTAEQVEMLFDSIMQGYPINSMLFWKVNNEAKNKYKFYSFLSRYIEDIHTHNEEISTSTLPNFIAVLDGQQRLTSLYLGLCGSYAYRKKHTQKFKKENYPTRRLYLNLSRTLPNENENRYEFKFLASDATNDQTFYIDSDKNIWFKVAEIMQLNDPSILFDFCMNNQIGELGRRILALLRDAIHTQYFINYYKEDTPNPDKAVNIFVRINSGGTELTLSRIILSMIIANWTNVVKDARTEINNLVDTIKDKGFRASEDFVVKAFLMLYHHDVRSKLKYFSNEFVDFIEQHWQAIRDSIIELFDLLKKFGFNGNTLTSYNATLPILFYIYHTGKYKKSYITESVGCKEDRAIIKKWLLKVILNKSFGASSDSTLIRARRCMLLEDKSRLSDKKEDFTEKIQIKKFDKFPAEEISSSIGIFEISDENLEEWLMTQKDNAYAFIILSILYPHLDYANNDFHLDHMHPMDAFKKDLNPDHDKKTHNSILNLQMLDGNENKSKQDKSLKEWVDLQNFKNEHLKAAFYENKIIPETSLDFANFNTFIEKRKVLLKQKLREALY